MKKRHPDFGVALFHLSARTLLVDKIERRDFCFSRVLFEVRCHCIGAEKSAKNGAKRSSSKCET